MYWKNQRIHLTCFGVIFALLQRSGAKPTVSPKYSPYVVVVLPSLKQVLPLNPVTPRETLPPS